MVTPTGDSVGVTTVLADPDQYPRHFFVATSGSMPGGATVDFSVLGVTDLAIQGSGGNPVNQTVSLAISPFAASICGIQEFDAEGFSPMDGDTVIVAGFVTLGDIPSFEIDGDDASPEDRLSIWVQEPGGCGVNVFSYFPSDSLELESSYADIAAFGVKLNDFVQIRGRVTEFVSGGGNGAVTEIAALPPPDQFYRFLLRGLDGPEPIVVATGDAGDEALEGTLVHTEGTAINGNSLAVYVDDGSGSIQLFQNFSSLDLTRFTVGDRIEVTGIITQYDGTPPYFSGYELVPQSQDAISKVEGDFASDRPVVKVERRVLVPSLGEKILIETISPARSDLVVEIFDRVGRQITTLYDGVGLGRLDFRWDGRAQDGTVVDPGMYLCHVRSVSLDGGDVKTDSAPIVVGVRLNGGGAAP